MKKLLIILMILGVSGCATMKQPSVFDLAEQAGADKKITEMTADTSPSSDDLVVTVDDPGGTPANKKVTLSNLGKGIGNVDAITGDSATAFFDTGAVETNYGGTGQDLSSTTGIMGLNSGSYVDVDTAAELETYAGLGAFFSDYADDATASAMRTTLGLTVGSDIEAYDADIIKADETENISANWEWQDNVHASFGNDDDFSWVFNSTSGNLELVNSSDTTLFWVETDGSANSAAVASPAWAQYDSDAVGADRADEYTGGIEIPMTTTTEDAEDSDMNLYIQQGGSKTLVLAFDESDDQWETTKTLEAATLTEGGNAVYNSTETPGGELGGTWASPTVDDTGISLTSITIGSLLGVDSIDATGSVDMDYGSVDVTDHTFVSDGGTTIIDGATITVDSANDPYIFWNESDGTDTYLVNDDTGNQMEFSTDSTASSNNFFVVNIDGSGYTVGDGGDDDIVFTADNDDTDGTITRYADEKTWEFSNIIGIAPQTYDATDNDDTDFTIGTTGTSSIILMTGDNDGDNDSIDLQNPTRAGQIVRFYASANIDADDTITVDTTTDTTCTGCTTVTLDEVGDSFECMALTTSLWNCWQLNEVP